MNIHLQLSLLFFTALSMLPVAIAPTQPAQNQTQPPKDISYKAAGILPYAFDEYNQIWVLIGLEAIKNNQACDFGGGKDFNDHNQPALTAAREASEEILFIFDENTDEFEHLLESKNLFLKSFDIRKTQSKTYNFFLNQIDDTSCYESISNEYITYFIKIPYESKLTDAFAKRKKQYATQLPFSWNEKITLCWVKLQDILAAIENSSSIQGIWVSTENESIELFPLFAQSLMQAHHNGIFKKFEIHQHISCF